MKLELPGKQSPAAVTWLRASSIAATGDITLGGQAFGVSTQTGLLEGTAQLTELAPTITPTRCGSHPRARRS